MTVMTATTSSSGIPHGRPFTVDDLEAMPDDGNRYELIDGMLIVSPAPGRRHQDVAFRLAVLLDETCPVDLHMIIAPFAVRVSQTTELQPDILVARDSDFTDKLLPVAPLLAVEVMSPSSVINDLNNKKAAYERMGVASYWVVDPQQPSVTIFELTADGLFHLVAEVKGDDVFEAERPFPVRIVPTELLSRPAR
jgi:Uma2 family endonuclease